MAGLNGRRESAALALTREWEQDERWSGVVRGYSADDVVRLQGSIAVEHTLARLSAERLWELLQETGSSARSAR